MSGDGQSSQQPQDTPKQGGQPENNKKEETPDGPGEKPQGEKPQDKPKDGEDPQGNREDPLASDKKNASKNPDQETQDPAAVGDSIEQWGNLPIHLRELFRAEGGDRLPARYRDWIDSYYRRLNRRSSGD